MRISCYSLLVISSLLLVTGLIIAQDGNNQGEPSPASGGRGETTPPQVGSWVKYHIKRSQIDGAGFKVLIESTLKISILGKEEDRKTKETSYWVELVANEDKDDRRIIKFLINPDGKPVLEKLFTQLPNLNPVEIDMGIWSTKTGLTPPELFDEIAGNMLIVPLSLPMDIGKTKPVNNKQVKVKDGGEMLDCRQFIVENTSAKTKDKTTTKLWFVPNGKFPFPHIPKMLIFEDDFQTQIIATDYDTKGAVSLIKDKPMKLEFKESVK